MAKRLIVIAGPTASGKTELAIQLANYLETEIISCDSRQVFKEMSIGTAKPTPEELARATHHLINSHSIHENFSAGDFEREGLALLSKLFQKYDDVVMVGGSGLYIRALCHGLDNFPEIKEGIRDQLNRELIEGGIEKLQQELKNVDPEYYSRLDISNSQRLIRGLEIYRSSGQPASYFRKANHVDRPFGIVKIGVELPRETLYDRINKRVDVMVNDGLIDEVKSLESLKQLNALNTVGYSEIFSYLSHEINLDEALERIKRNTRRYAKRQITWFNREQGLIWVEQPDLEKLKKLLDLNS